MLQKPIVKVVIISKSSELENKLDCLNLDSRMKLIVVTCENFSDQLVKAGDLLIVDGIIDDIETVKNEEVIKNRSCIFYGSNEEVQKLNQEYGLLHCFKDIWSKAASDEVIQFWYQQLLQNLSDTKDSEMAHIFLNTLMNNTNDFIWFKDLRGVHLMVNEPFGQLVDKSVNECVGRGHYYIWDLEPDEYADGEFVCLETDEEVVRVKEKMLFEEKIKAHNRFYLLETFKSPLMNAQGELFGTVGVARDVTETRNHICVIEALISTNLLAIVTTNKEKMIEHCNSEFESLTGCSLGDLKGRSFNDVEEILKGYVNEEIILHDAFDDVLGYAYLYKKN